MGWECRVEADSISPDGNRIISWVVSMPTLVHYQLIRHRMFSVSVSSLRAVPVQRLTDRVGADPYIPEVWGSNQKGMQPGEELDPAQARASQEDWRAALKNQLWYAGALKNRGVHKELVNKLLSPFSWTTMIITATDWKNFFQLRCHPDAQYEIRKLAEMMRSSLGNSFPRKIHPGQWHLPFISLADEECYPLDVLVKISAARSARVSYETHEGKRDLSEDLRLAKDLLDHQPPHSGPWEHQATPDKEWLWKKTIIQAMIKEHPLQEHERWMDNILYSANFKGWQSQRYLLEQTCN